MRLKQNLVHLIEMVNSANSSVQRSLLNFKILEVVGMMGFGIFSALSKISIAVYKPEVSETNIH